MMNPLVCGHGELCPGVCKDRWEHPSTGLATASLLPPLPGEQEATLPTSVFGWLPAQWKGRSGSQRVDCIRAISLCFLMGTKLSWFCGRVEDRALGGGHCGLVTDDVASESHVC